VRRLTAPAPQENGYIAFRRSVGRSIETLELYSARFFGPGSSPFELTGALAVALLTISLVSGALLLLWYVPAPERASAELARLGREVPLGSLLRAVHRACAEILVLVILFHLVRMWATGRHLGPRARNFAIGLAALPLVGLIGWAGYTLPWDERAMVLLAWGREIAIAPDRWPIIGWLHLGSLSNALLFSPENQADQLLRMFALHVGGALVMIWVVLWHTRRVTPPRAGLPIPVWVGLALIVLLVAAGLPMGREPLLAFNPFAPPTVVAVDAIVCFPLLFYPLLGAPLLAALIVLIWVGLALLPRLEPSRPLVACVRESACVGCRLCLQDCPYGAIAMTPHPDPLRRSRGRETARVLPAHCNACGICVGSCGFDAIEIPALTSDEILARIDRALQPEEALPTESPNEGDVE